MVAGLYRYRTSKGFTVIVDGAKAARQSVLFSVMQKGNVMRRAFGYIRVSTANQVNNGESLTTQRELIEAICTLEGLSLAGIFEEEAVSGSKPLSSRPEGSHLLAALEKGDVVIALRLDRMFRNTADALATLADFKRAGIGLYLKDIGGMVSGDSVGELVFSLMSSVAAFERARTRERIIEVKASLKKQNRYMGGDVPLGSIIVDRNGEKVLEQDAELMSVVAGLKRKGYSSRLISGHLAHQGIVASHHAICRLLKRVSAST